MVHKRALVVPAAEQQLLADTAESGLTVFPAEDNSMPADKVPVVHELAEAAADRVPRVSELAAVAAVPAVQQAARTRLHLSAEADKVQAAVPV
jgi:hypothetical protein